MKTRLGRPNKYERAARLFASLGEMGISYEDADALRRIQMTLHHWAEEECNGTIQRDGEDGEGAPRRYWEDGRGEHHRGSIVADRERGALKRLKEIMKKYPRLWSYHQGDPRGCALYVGLKKDVRGHDLDSVYNRGVAVVL